MDPAHLELSLLDGMKRSGMTYDQLWLRQYGLGGSAEDLELQAYVLGLLAPDRAQYNVIAQAINEYFIEQGGDHPVAYWDTSANPSRAASPEEDESGA